MGGVGLQGSLAGGRGPGLAEGWGDFGAGGGGMQGELQMLRRCWGGVGVVLGLGSDVGEMSPGSCCMGVCGGLGFWTAFDGPPFFQRESKKKKKLN